MKKYNPNQEGFSFVETLITVAIVIFVLLALLGLYANYSNIYRYQRSLISTSDSARVAMNELQSASLQSDKIVSSHTFSGTTYTSGQHTLVLETPSINSSGNIVSDKYDYTAFYVTGSNLYIVVQADTASSRPSRHNQISDSIASITFTYNNADLSKADKIDTAIQMQSAAGRQTVQYNLNQAIYLRNR